MSVEFNKILLLVSIALILVADGHIMRDNADGKGQNNKEDE
jgi:hypothetical protein